MGHAMSPRVPLVKELMKIGQAHYPMCVDLSFFVNTPIVFQLCWTIIKTVRDHPIISHPLPLHVHTVSFIRDSVKICLDVSHKRGQNDGTSEIKVNPCSVREMLGHPLLYYHWQVRSRQHNGTTAPPKGKLVGIQGAY